LHIFPSNAAWESHLFGALVGGFIAFFEWKYFNIGMPP
jgi:hypothetical protein